jgi:hypothetical protein
MLDPAVEAFSIKKQRNRRQVTGLPGSPYLFIGIYGKKAHECREKPGN